MMLSKQIAFPSCEDTSFMQKTKCNDQPEEAALESPLEREHRVSKNKLWQQNN
jgi:hypothetical protein